MGGGGGRGKLLSIIAKGMKKTVLGTFKNRCLLPRKKRGSMPEDAAKSVQEGAPAAAAQGIQQQGMKYI